jgi:hypothetical protein
MNYTKSGIIACGAPNSRARFLGEAKAALETPVLLLLTDEGAELAERFFRSIGTAPTTPEAKAECLADPRTFQFLVGIIFALGLI